MGEQIKHALASDRTIDMTTTGRKTGQPRRIELWFHHVAGHFYITVSPGRHDWYANLLAHPAFTLHLKQSVRAALPARATPILEAARRHAILTAMHQQLGGHAIRKHG